MLPYRQHAVKGFVALLANDALVDGGYSAIMATRESRIGPRRPVHLYIDEWFDYFGLGDAEVALRIGVDRSTVFRWRNDKRKLSPEKQAALATALDIEPERFWNPPPLRGEKIPESLDKIVGGASKEVRDAVFDFVRRMVRSA